MDVSTAREIIKRAKADDVYDGPMPEEDDAAITEAQGIVKLAEEAWGKHIRGPEVESILNLAKGSENGNEPEEGEPEAESEEEAEASEGAQEEESDEDKPQIPSLQSGDSKLQKVEPWENYGDDTVKNITEGLNYFAEESPDDILDILRHVWQFETAHKNRARILTHASEMYEARGGPVDTDQEAESNGSEEEEGQDEDEPTSESDSGSEGVSDESGDEAEGEESESADDDGDAEADSESKTGKTVGERQAAEDEKAAKSKARGSEGGGEGSGYAKLIKGVEDELKRERLDVPKPPEEKAPELPWNWGEIKSKQLQDLHMQYSSCAYYKSYRVALNERIAQHCKEAADELHATRMVSIDKYDEKGKEKKVGLIEAEIASDKEVKKWRTLQRKHEQLAAADRREMDSYYKVVEALSRLETMRHNAWERSRR